MASHASADVRRAEILAAAERQFDQDGFAATTMDSVATSAGMSKGSIYNYFASKHDLFAAVFRNHIQDGWKQLQELVALPKPAHEKLSEVIDGCFEMVWTQKRMGRLVLEFWANAVREGPDGHLCATFEQLYRDWRSVITGLLNQGVAEGTFRLVYPPEVAASLVVAVVDGLTVQMLMDHTQPRREEFVAGTKRAIMLGLNAAGVPLPENERTAAPEPRPTMQGKT